MFLAGTVRAPKTFVITTPPGKKTGEDMVYLCQLSTGTLKKRSGR